MQRLFRIFLLSGIFCFAQAFAQADIPATQIKVDSFSLEELQQAAESGDPDAQYALGYLYYYGKNNVPKNTQQGFDWIKRASVQGQEEAVQAMRLLEPGSAVPAENKIAVPVNASMEASSITPSAVQKPVVENAAKTTAAGQKSLDASGRYYAIQLMASTDKNQLNNYVKINGLKGKTSIQKNGGKYILLYGHYTTHGAATNALKRLSVAIKAQKPWVRVIL